MGMNLILSGILTSVVYHIYLPNLILIQICFMKSKRVFYEIKAMCKRGLVKKKEKKQRNISHILYIAALYGVTHLSDILTR